jgi:cell division protein FtsB
VGYVGQGIDGSGENSTTWSDHTDVRPTILSLVGLKDDYVHDGRVISEILQGYAQPAAMKKSTNFTALAQVYKQLNASFGAFAMAVLRSSTKALASNDAGDATYTSIESQIASLTSQRDALAAQIKTALNGAEFNGQVIGSAQAQSLINQGIALLNQASALPH